MFAIIQEKKSLQNEKWLNLFLIEIKLMVQMRQCIQCIQLIKLMIDSVNNNNNNNNGVCYQKP